MFFGFASSCLSLCIFKHMAWIFKECSKKGTSTDEARAEKTRRQRSARSALLNKGSRFMTPPLGILILILSFPLFSLLVFSLPLPPLLF